MASTKISQLQLLQQNLQQVMIQKQQFQSQMMELDSVLIELKTTDKAYKIVGKLMIASSKEELLKDLQEKKEVTDVRVKNFEKQEKKLKENLEKLQQEVVEEMHSSGKK